MGRKPAEYPLIPPFFSILKRSEPNRSQTRPLRNLSPYMTVSMPVLWPPSARSNPESLRQCLDERQILGTVIIIQILRPSRRREAYLLLPSYFQDWLIPIWSFQERGEIKSTRKENSLGSGCKSS